MMYEDGGFSDFIRDLFGNKHIDPTREVITGYDDILLDAEESMRHAITEHFKQTNKTFAYAYVDGSFNPKTNVYGSGILFHIGQSFHHVQPTIPLCVRGSMKEFADMRNVGGEIIGAIEAAHIAVQTNCKTLELYYDYQGLEDWVTGAWESRKRVTKIYGQYMRRLPIHFIFHKVPAHTGNIENEIVDKLAKFAAGI